MTPTILVLNAGSSSVKFSVFRLAGATLHRLLWGEFEGLGTAPHFSVEDGDGATVADRRFGDGEVATQEEAVHRLFSWLKGQSAEFEVAAVGHRVANGGPTFTAAVLVDPDVLAMLAGFEPLAPPTSRTT